MEKLHLQSIIEKYHLDGLVEKSKWKIKDKQLSIPLISANKNLFGTIFVGFEEEDVEFVVSNTSKLLKLLNITDKSITLELERNGKLAKRLKITDSSYKLDYVLADMALAPRIPEVTEPLYEVKFDITEEFIDKYIKANKAISSATEDITTQITLMKDSLNFKLGVESNYSNKIELSTAAEFSPESLLTFEPIILPSEELKAIFDANRCVGKGELSSQGLIKFLFKEKLDDAEIISQYWVIAN